MRGIVCHSGVDGSVDAALGCLRVDTEGINNPAHELAELEAPGKLGEVAPVSHPLAQVGNKSFACEEDDRRSCQHRRGRELNEMID